MNGIMLAALIAQVQHGSIVQNDAPVAIDKCDLSYLNRDRLLVDVTFHDQDNRGATAVKFGFRLLDGFGALVDSETGIMYGNFSIGTTVKPRNEQMWGTPETQPDYPNSPGWAFLNAWGNDVQGLECRVLQVRLSDGSIWNASQSATPQGGVR